MSVTVNGLQHGLGSRADDTPVGGRGTAEREPEEPLSGPQGGGQERKRSTAWPRGTEAGGRPHGQGVFHAAFSDRSLPRVTEATDERPSHAARPRHRRTLRPGRERL